jgi:transcriptional regulator with XRE-family HTH domain
MAKFNLDQFLKDKNISQEKYEKAQKETEEYEREYWLKQQRESERFLQRDLARRMKVSQKRISVIENADIDSLRVATLKKYAEGLGGKLRMEIIIPEETIELDEDPDSVRELV